jgi:hypothetical protein
MDEAPGGYFFRAALRSFRNCLRQFSDFTFSSDFSYPLAV